MSTEKILKIQRANILHEQLEMIWNQLREMERNEVNNDLELLLSEAREKVGKAQEEVLKRGRAWLNKN